MNRRWSCLIGTMLLVFFSGSLFGCGSSSKPTLLSDVKKRGYLVVGVNYGNPPFGLYTVQNGHYVLKGFDIDLSTEIAKRMFPGNEHPVRFRQILTSTRLVAVNT